MVWTTKHFEVTPLSANIRYSTNIHFDNRLYMSKLDSDTYDQKIFTTKSFKNKITNPVFSHNKNLAHKKSSKYNHVLTTTCRIS